MAEGRWNPADFTVLATWIDPAVPLRRSNSGRIRPDGWMRYGFHGAKVSLKDGGSYCAGRRTAMRVMHGRCDAVRDRAHGVRVDFESASDRALQRPPSASARLRPKKARPGNGAGFGSETA